MKAMVMKERIQKENGEMAERVSEWKIELNGMEGKKGKNKNKSHRHKNENYFSYW